MLERGFSVIHEKTAEAAGRFGAVALADALRALLEEKDIVTLALPGGRSAQPLLRALAKQELPWSRIHVFLVSEKWVPSHNQESNFSLVSEELLGQLIAGGQLPLENVHPFEIENGVAGYARELKPFKGFDAIVLGVGADGHVGFLYPNHFALFEEGMFVELTDGLMPPAHCMTASAKLLRGAQYGIVLFTSEEKRAAYTAFNDDAISPEQCPAKYIKELPRALVLTTLE